jgi:tetratricopeptide (TPR) repeat protein
MKSLYFLAYIYFEKKEWATALEYALNSVKMYESKRNETLSEYYDSLSLIAQIYLNKGELDKAKSYCLQAMQADVTECIIIAKCAMASIYTAEKAYTKAKKCYEECQTLIEESKEMMVILTYYKQYSDFYLKQGKYKDAAQYLSKYIELLMPFQEEELKAKTEYEARVRSEESGV